MNLLPVSASLLRLGEPLPIALRDPKGLLLLPKGGLIADSAQMQRLMVLNPHAQPHEHERLRQPWVAALGRMVLRNETLGRIAQADGRSAGVSAPMGGGGGGGNSGGGTLSRAGDPAGALGAGPFGHPGRGAADESNPAGPSQPRDLLDRCLNLRIRLATVMRPPIGSDFEDRLLPVAHALRQLVREDADGALMVLLHDAATDLQDYGIRHSLVVGALTALVAEQDATAWPSDVALPLVCAALTMNLSILALQDQMATQSTPPSPSQRAALHDHGQRSMRMLREVGITDPTWLDAVAHHHEQPPGPSRGARCARLVHKADVYAAAISPRRTRAGLSATAAARVAFLDAQGSTDPAGSWLVKALGLYPPGTLVALNNDEVGVVCRRGAHPSSPWVATLLSAAGNPVAEPLIRNTTRLTHRVVRALPMAESRVRVPLSAVLDRRPVMGAAEPLGVDGF